MNPEINTDPYTTIEKVTPELAAEWLTRNTHNRNIRKRAVDTWASAMTAGQWVLNGESIKFDPEGVLVDGQHRLAAVVQSGITIESVVAWNVHMQSQITVDVGTRRSIADHLSWRGEANATGLGAALGILWRFKRGDGFSGTAKTSTTATYLDLFELLDQNPHIRDSVRVAHRLNGALRLPSGAMAALHHILWESAPEEADLFFDLLTTGAGLSSSDPIYILRRAFERDQRETRKMPVRYRLALTIKTWNSWINGESRKSIGWRASGPQAEPFPEPVDPNPEFTLDEDDEADTSENDEA